MDKHLHIVSFDIPSPPDYGGVIDVYYRAKALKNAGVYIVLHCFAYGRDTTADLSEIADEVHFYKRQKRLIDQLSPLPFIVKSRINAALSKRLLRDEHPILLEGHHCSFLLLDRRFKKRKLFVRIHNVEHEYYSALALQEKQVFKSLYYKLEALKLKRYEHFLKRASALFCLSINDCEYYNKINEQSYLWNIGIDVDIKTEDIEQRRMALFHGNLSVGENQQAVLRLFEVWSKAKLELLLVIAGKNPPEILRQKLSSNPNIKLIANPSRNELFLLIEEAQFNLSISESATGTKIKLLHNLLHGNRCVANEKMVSGSGLESELELFNTDNELINILVQTNFIDKLLRQQRSERILENFDPEKQVQKIIPILFSAD